MVEDFFDAADDPVRDAVRSAIDGLARNGARLRKIRLTTDLPTVAAAQQTIMQVEAAEVHAELHRDHPDDYAPRMRALVETGQLIPATYYLRAQRIRRRFRQEIEALLGDVDCLVMPTVSDVAPPSASTGDRTFQAPWSLIGVPALTMPCGLVDGLPVGLQFVTGAWEEARLLTIGRWAEEVLPAIGRPDC